MISSAGNMKFWLYLCQASSSPGSEGAVAPFLQAAKKGKASLAAYCQQYNADLVHKVSHLLVLLFLGAEAPYIMMRFLPFEDVH